MSEFDEPDHTDYDALLYNEGSGDCNGCRLECLKRRAKTSGRELIRYCGTWYWKNEPAIPGQGTNVLKDGTPIQFIAWFMSESHCCGR